MPNAYAISTGAQLLDDQLTLTFDVLIIDPSLEWGSTYFASSVPVLSNDEPEELRVKVSEKILIDGYVVTQLQIQAQDLIIPAYEKGIVSTAFEWPTLDAPAETPPADVPPTDVPPTDVPPTDVPPTDVPPVETPPASG